MNEVLHILPYIKNEKNIIVKKLDIAGTFSIKDMKTIIKDTKEYLNKKREELKK
ncbi:hypothetical protein [Aliarcobacter thereius]|uniref:hypothetical protein n=1 Tax=Aliarcobacter thereius TaxID=544718 RepID=UPI0013F4C8B8|nr:hypothetical protein [Aliarcobacter thereius]